ncbi:PRD domain-containing protein [Tessaracoccus caeni]|uniref:PRD domain-containing protein n=1 Tax=Tessaracoccus caeni TaxID=3031239 RepID=UPI0023DB514C|nr:PRD domain-containing protein [Tessaracoccus caeni]MDF1489136.1 PRD domain-containing protein [Tessaracoccus caeni]
MRVVRVISNNAVLAEDDKDLEVVVLGRGVGFGRRPGDVVEKERVEQVFLASTDGHDQHLTTLLAETPAECLRVAGQIAELAHRQLGINVTQSLILPLADHLNFAMRRVREGVTIEYPLQWEVSQLYPVEYGIGVEAIAIADEGLGVHLDAQECTAIAMHLVNVQFAGPGHAETIRMTEIIARIFQIVEDTFAIKITQPSMSASRFVTHLRYVFVRIATGKQIADPHPALFDAISNTHPEAMACAMKVRFLIEVRFDASLTLDETAYIALHIARLCTEIAAHPSGDKTPGSA